MYKKIIFSVALVLGLVSVLQANTVVTPYSATSNPICKAPGILAVETHNLNSEGSLGISFDYAANYWDEDGDSAPLLVKKGDGTSAGWKFLSYSDNSMATVYES